MLRRAALLLLCLSPLASARAQTVAVRGGKVIAVDGPTLATGTVLIRDGRIVAVGAEIEIPYDAKVIDARGKVVFPGMINAHTGRGMDRANERLPVTPFLDAGESLDPSSLAFEDALRDGVTALHVIPGNDTVVGGVGRVVHPLGLSVEDMTIKAPSGIKLCAAGKKGYDRVQQRAALRAAFAELADHVDGIAEKRFAEEEKKAGREVVVGPEEARKRGRALVRAQDVGEKYRNLWLLTQGRLDCYFSCPEPRDVGFALAFAKEHGFLERTILVLGAPCFKAVDEIKASGRPVVLPPGLTHREPDPETGEEVETFVAGPFAAAGIPFAFQTYVRSSYAERFLWYQAARCVREGVDRAVALRAITLTPARILGLGERLGAIGPGRDADLLILSGDPLSARTVVEKVLIGGAVVYERSKDYRLRRLLDGRAPDDDDRAPQGEHEPHDEETPPRPPADEVDPSSGGGHPAEEGR
ncbi:MAG: hypothetical protein D6731_22755 [Planctomycetota bacterium]|nr:MAG: hypothetical protein D6731_22755 [Planctomycetota bacterium]